ncbi:MAG: beta-lactamase family protein [Chloroflexi bacterium]|nr:beta-lactamase family protein [Chloroflexota bacterium]
MPAKLVRKPNRPKRALQFNGAALRAPLLHFTDSTRGEKLATAFPAVREVVQEFVSAQNIPGLAFGIVVDGALAYADALGLRHIESGAPVTCDTVFRIASMSKSFIAMSILKLRDAKKLRLDDPAAKYIPELKTLAYPTRDSAVITVRDLLTMSPGFPEDNPWGDRQMAMSEREFAKRLRAGIPFSNAPNTTFEYSNYGYAILGRIITRVSGIKFQNYVAKNILKPLNMHATTWDKTRVPSAHLAQGYRWEAETWKPELMLPDGAFAAMAGLFTTVPDFARYMACLLDAFPPRDEAERGPVKRATARAMQQLMCYEELVTRTLAEDNVWRAVSGYGYGLAVWHDERFGQGVSHGGGLPGFGSYFYLLPAYGMGVVALSNKTYARVGAVFPKIFDVLAKTGGLTRRTIPPAPILEQMRGVVQRWLEDGPDDEIAAHAADNFYLDADAAHRRAELNALRTEVGAYTRVGEFCALNALRGTWRVECENGGIDVLVTLTPTLPPRIQMVKLTSFKQE